MDNCIRGITEDGGIAFCAVDASELVGEMEKLHKTSAVASAALGRLLIAAGMMGEMMKHVDDKITLRVNGGGVSGTVLAVSNAKGQVKGYISNPLADMPIRNDGKLDVGGAVGTNGTLSVCKDLGLKEPYVGQIPLVSGEIAEDITHYYAVSEQVPTVCGLGVLVNKDLSIQNAGGYIIQLLPGATEKEIEKLENNIKNLKSVTQMLNEGKTPKQWIDIALSGFEPQVLATQKISYSCDCNDERVEKIIISLGKKELEKMLLEEKNAEVVCHFCNKKYNLDIQSILNKI